MFKTADGKSYGITFLLVSFLFPLWAICNGMIDAMDKHFQDFYHLSKAESANVQFSHYLGYFFMAMPSGWLVRKLGYKGGIVIGLLIAAAGCLWFFPATRIDGFWAVLVAVCVTAMGLTFLETVANPYTTVLGSPRYASARINLAQSFNAVGWPLGPFIGGLFFYSAIKGTHQEQVNAAHQTLWVPYAAIAIIAVVLAAIFLKSKMPEPGSGELATADVEIDLPPEVVAKTSLWVPILLFINVCFLGFALGMIVRFFAQIFYMDKATLADPEAMKALGIRLDYVFWVSSSVFFALGMALFLGKRKALSASHSIWAHPHFSAATIAQFLYVAAQAGIFSFFINYVVEDMPAIGESLKSAWFIGGDAGSIFRNGAWHVSDQGATKLLSYFGFILFLIGRYTGALILKRTSAHKMLGLYSLINVILMIVIVAKLQWLSVVALFLSFFFMSIMFPTIFALGIFGLGATKAKSASPFIVMAIMGGAVLPKVMGAIGDRDGMSAGFIVPAVCFAAIAFYGFFWSKLSGSDGLVGADVSKGH